MSHSSLSHSSVPARGAFLGAVLGLALGCAAAPTAPTSDTADCQAAFTASITPAAASLAPGGTLAFSASAPEKASWITTDGTIDGAGLYTAPAAAGTYRVIAQWPAHQRSDTAVVTVVPVAPVPAPVATPTLTSLAVVPDSLWLTQSDTFALAAVGRTTAGDSVSPAVVWSATGGAIDTAGQYIAGLVIWCELAPPTWNGSPVLFTWQAALEPRLAPMPLTATASVRVE